MTNIERELLTRAEAAEYLGVTPRWLEKYQNLVAGPPLVRLSPRMIRYRRADLDRWVASVSERLPDRGTAA